MDEAIDRPWEILPGCDLAMVFSAGLSAVWAMAGGVPIAASDTPGVRLLLPDGTAALLSPPGKAGALAWRLCRLADDASKRMSKDMQRAA